jgi:hypothetical protein
MDTLSGAAIGHSGKLRRVRRVVAAAELQAFGSFDPPVELYGGRADDTPIGDRDKHGDHHPPLRRSSWPCLRKSAENNRGQQP